MQTWQLTLWLAALMSITFVAGCTYGYTFSRNKHRKAPHARKR
jgi:uncharacterized membrane-anchored protein YhcB (DUF1043 family)